MEEGNLPKDVKDNIQPNKEIETKQSFDFNSLFDKITNELKEQRLVFLDFLNFNKNHADEDKKNSESRSRKNWLFWIQVLSLFTTVIALSFTYYAITKADKANQISKESLTHAIKIDSVENDRRNKEAVINRIKDSINDLVVKESLVIAKKSANASNDLVNRQIISLKDVQDRFEKENQTILRAVPFFVANDSIFSIPYKIYNYAKLPAFRHNSFVFGIYSKDVTTKKDELVYVDTLKKVFSYLKFRYEKEEASLLTNDYFDRETLQLDFDQNLIDYQKLPNNTFIFYFAGKIEYSPPQKKKEIRIYEFIIRMEVTKYNKNPFKFSYNYLFSDDFSISKN